MIASMKEERGSKVLPHRYAVYPLRKVLVLCDPLVCEGEEG
jgi:hypothetical protein